MEPSLVELGPIFGDTHSTINYLRQQSLLKRQFICCRNESKEVKSKSSDGCEFKCATCGKCYSIRTNSFFTNVHIQLRYLLLLTYLFAVGTPVKYATIYLNKCVSEKSVTQWYNFLCEVMSRNLFLHHTMLGGVGTLCQLDESALGHTHKYNRGYIQGSGIKWVFGIIDTFTKKCCLRLVPDRSRETLYPIITDNIICGTQINSDEAAVYFTLNQEGYIHHTVKHKDFYVNPTDGTHTNIIENFWCHLKNKIRSMHGLKEDLLPLHLDEFTYCWNYKFSNSIYNQLLSDISKQYPI